MSQFHWWLSLTSEWPEHTFLPLDTRLHLWLSLANGTLEGACNSSRACDVPLCLGVALFLLGHWRLQLFGFLCAGAQYLLHPSISLEAIFQVESSSLIGKPCLCARTLDVFSVTSTRVQQKFHLASLSTMGLLSPELYGPGGRTAWSAVWTYRKPLYGSLWMAQ